MDPVTDDWLRSAAPEDSHYEIARSVGPRSLILVPLDSGRDCLGVLTAGSTREETRFGRRQLHLAVEIARRAGLAIENARLYRDAQAANQAKANFLSVMSRELTVEVEDGSPRLRTDPPKVRQILLNLISNALKFTSAGSVRVGAEVRDGQAVFTVADTGVGIPDDQLDSIFERFSQLEAASTRRRGGTGLGLTVARSFARLLGGGIDVESEVGAGSTLMVWIPASPPG